MKLRDFFHGLHSSPPNDIMQNHSESYFLYASWMAKVIAEGPEKCVVRAKSLYVDLNATACL